MSETNNIASINTTPMDNLYKKLAMLESYLPRLREMRADFDSIDDISENLLETEQLFSQQKNVLLQKCLKPSLDQANVGTQSDVVESTNEVEKIYLSYQQQFDRKIVKTEKLKAITKKQKKKPRSEAIRRRLSPNLQKRLQSIPRRFDRRNSKSRSSFKHESKCYESPPRHRARRSRSPTRSPGKVVSQRMSDTSPLQWKLRQHVSVGDKTRKIQWRRESHSQFSPYSSATPPHRHGLQAKHQSSSLSMGYSREKYFRSSFQFKPPFKDLSNNAQYRDAVYLSVSSNINSCDAENQYIHMTNTKASVPMNKPNQTVYYNVNDPPCIIANTSGRKRMTASKYVWANDRWKITAENSLRGILKHFDARQDTRISSKKLAKKKVHFADEISPNYDSDYERQTNIETQICERLRNLRRNFDMRMEAAERTQNNSPPGGNGMAEPKKFI